MSTTNNKVYDIAVENADGVTIYYNYVADDNELEVTDVGKYINKVVIPEEVTYMGRTRKVTAIGDNAFLFCMSLRSVTIPDSVTNIGKGAFRGCFSLTTATIPDSVKSIGDNAFEGCEGLMVVTIPNSVTNIGEGAFRGCRSLTSIPYDIAVKNADGITIYYNYTVDGKELVVTRNKYNAYCGNVVIPEKVTYMGEARKVTAIGDSAFEGCSGLTAITIPNSVTNIGNSAFDSCGSLTMITIPNSVTSIGYSAFGDCVGLTAVTIPNSVTNIGSSAFARCRSLTVVTIPNGVTNIKDGVFFHCHSLTSINIPNSVTSIGNSTFWGCKCLTSVTIPDSVTNIGKGAFGGCRSLTSIPYNIAVKNADGITIYYNYTVDGKELVVTRNKYNAYCGNIVIPEEVTYMGQTRKVTAIGDCAFEGCGGLTAIKIPNSVTNIGNSAFDSCGSLTMITIPNSVTSIGYSAFGDCVGLTAVTIPNSVTNIEIAAFYFTNKDEKLVEITSLIEEPMDIDEFTFQYELYENALLYIPKGTMKKYKAHEGWKEFVQIKERENEPSEGGETLKG